MPNLKPSYPQTSYTTYQAYCQTFICMVWALYIKPFYLSSPFHAKPLYKKYLNLLKNVGKNI